MRRVPPREPRAASAGRVARETYVLFERTLREYYFRILQTTTTITARGRKLKIQPRAGYGTRR